MELRLVEFLEPPDCGCVKREVLLDRAIKLGGTTSQHHAEWLLAATWGGKNIPREWEEVYPVFPDTRWTDDQGREYLMYLAYDREKQ